MSEFRDSIYKGLLAGGVTLAVCLLAVVGYFVFYGGSEAKAERACKEAVEADLTAPGTAEWVDVEVADSGDTLTVRGSVDAENSYGAKVRGTFSCEVDDDTVIDHSVSGQ